MGSNEIYTIGREFGSLGKQVGQELAKRLGIKFYDKELLQKAAKESGLCEEIFESHDEKPTNSFLYSLVMDTYTGGSYSTAPFLDMPLNHKVFLAQFDAIKKIAANESCVIVGRCADYILEDIPNHLNVFVYAPEEARLKNCVENLQMDPQTAKKMMRDVDAARNRYHKAYIPGWQSVFYHKDLMIDSSRFGIDGTAKILADIVRNQWG